jgi:N-acetylmuramoyl-L-alanine amidase
MRTVYISAGHSTQTGKDRGASGNGLIEGEVAAEFRALLVAELKKLGVPVIIDGNHTVLNDTLGWIKKFISPRCIAIDIHCNAAGETATGTEVIVPDNSSAFERLLATALCKETADVLGIRNRGVKTESQTPRKRLGWMRIAAECVLPELFFISNKYDCIAYRQNRNELARRWAIVIAEFARK